jgi:hypothetical protein
MLHEDYPNNGVHLSRRLLLVGTRPASLYGVYQIGEV